MLWSELKTKWNVSTSDIYQLMKAFPDRFKTRSYSTVRGMISRNKKSDSVVVELLDVILRHVARELGGDEHILVLCKQAFIDRAEIKNDLVQQVVTVLGKSVY